MSRHNEIDPTEVNENAEDNMNRFFSNLLMFDFLSDGNVLGILK